MIRRIMTAAALLISAGPANAATSGNELLTYCTSDLFGDRGVCDGYIKGATEVLVVFRKELPDSLRFCFPKSPITNGQVRDIVVEFLESQPKHRHQDARMLIVSAMALAFPCGDS